MIMHKKWCNVGAAQKDYNSKGNKDHHTNRMSALSLVLLDYDVDKIFTLVKKYIKAAQLRDGRESRNTIGTSVREERRCCGRCIITPTKEEIELLQDKITFRELNLIYNFTVPPGYRGYS